MLIPHHNPYFYQHQTKSIEQTFSLLSWNIHKENMTPLFHHKLHELLHIHPSDFLLFQEYKMPKHLPRELQGFSYAMGSNIQTKKYTYGLLTASTCSFDKTQIKLTHHKELLVSTRKSTLLTSHTFCNGDSLYLVNMHGINFVSAKVFSKELKMIKELLHTYDGAMIISGDFNNWNKKRMTMLEAFRQSLDLEKAAIEEEQHIKKVFSKPIDHIFYRGLKLITAKAINTKKVSDHNPIHATFQQL